MEIKRYEMMGWDGYDYLNDDGDWCKNEDVWKLESELNALRNPWIKTSDALPRLEEFVLAIDSCGERFLVQLFSDGSWMDEYDTLFLNMSYWMPIPAPNEVK